jgi:hypothetical protein
MTYEFTDREGDRLTLGESVGDQILTVHATSGEIASVYLEPDDARTLRDHLDELLGEERKASPATLEDAQALLIQVGKDLIRKGAPHLPPSGDLVVFMEPS